MIYTLILKDQEITYDLQYKKVKNINLRIKSDATVHVSANKRVPQKVIEDFLLSKADFILDALDKFKDREKEQKKFYCEDEIAAVVTQLCQKVYPYYEKRGVKYPEIKLRKMVSRWGSCNPTKGILTINTALMFAPKKCIEYVVLHEFTHFLEANHSARFYAELEKVCPDWKEHRKRLKDIILR